MSAPGAHFPEPWGDAPHIFPAGQIVAGRYRIVRFLGRGGMGEVYEAEDQELNERVALKTLRPEIALSERNLARFKAEIQLARRIAHPNVCRTFDLGRHTSDSAQSIAFLTMELLNGETLVERLGRTGKMSPLEAFPLVKQIAEGLDAAHRAQIVHRDFKSSNVMLVPVAGGSTRAVITDFGLAHGTGGDASDPTLTTSGHVAGTPAYMAPEQLVGAEVTSAADIYAFGLVVYEMLTGTRPFAGKDRGEAALRRLEESAPSPRNAVPDLDLRWEQAILKCLARNPSDRFRSAMELVRAITASDAATTSSTETLKFPKPVSRRKLALAGLLVVLAAGGIAWRDRLVPLFSRVPAVKHIAVIPFTNIGGDAAGQAFCEGLAETLSGKLSQLEQFQRSFWVVPAADLRGITTAAQARGRLGVNLMVAGSVQKTESGVRLIATLIDTATNKQLDSRIIDAPAAQPAALEDRVWAAVAGMLELQLPSAAQRAVTGAETNVAGAYEFYAQGLGYLRRYGLDNVDRAIDLFGQALGRDSRYALAFAALGEAYSDKYQLTKDPQWIDLARRNGIRAAELNSQLAPVHLTLGIIDYRTGRSDDAIHEFQRTIQLDPLAVTAWFWLGRTYDGQGKVREAEDAFAKTVNLRPDYWASYNGLGYFYYRHGRFTDAEQQFRTVVSLAPDNPTGYENLGAIYLELSRYQEAIGVLQKTIALKALKPTANAYSNLGTAYLFLKRYPEAVEMMQAAVKISPKNDILWRNLGDAFNSLPATEAKARDAYRNAVSLVEAQVALKPDDVSAISRLALYQAKLGERQAALAGIGQALTRAPSDAEILFTSALVYDLTGDSARALDAVKQTWKAGYSIGEIDAAPELMHLRAGPAYRAWRAGIRAGK